VSVTLDRAPWPLCGRDEELQFIVDALAGSDTRGVVLFGLPGVGKTRLAAEALRHARDRGLATAWAVATATTAAIPLGALAPLLPVECGAAADRFTMLARGCRAMAESGGDAKLVLGIDDAHLLDPISAELVHQAVTGSSIALVATLRRGEPAPGSITELWRNRLVERLEVGGLSRSETEQLMTSVLGGPIVGSAVQELWDATQGNVLFLRELVHGALQGGDLEQHLGVWRLRGPLAPGARLIDLVEQRLGQLTAGEERVIELVAFAEPVDVEVLRAITRPGDLESLERRGLLDVTAEADALRAKLAHPLYAEAIRARVPPLCTRRIFAELADASASTPRVGGVEVLRAAIWGLESGGVCAPESLVEACGQARLRFDHSLAERLARAAVERGGGFGARRALGDCLYAQGEFSEAHEHLRLLPDEATTELDRAQAAISYATNLMWGVGREVEAEAVLAAAQASIGDPDLVDEITSLRSRLVLATGRLAETIEAASAVLDKPDAVGDPVVLSAAAGLAPALALSGRTTEALAVLDQHLGLAFEHRDDQPHALGMLLVSRSTARWLAGDLTGAATEAEQLYDIGMALHSPEGICAGARNRGWAALARGRPRTAMRWIHEALAAVPAGDVNGLGCWCLALLAEAAAVAGDPRTTELLAQAEAARRPAIRVYDGQLALAKGWVAATEGNPAEAVAIVVEAARQAAASGAHGTEVHLLYAAVRFGYPEPVRHRLAELAVRVDGRWAPPFAAHAAALADRDGPRLERVAADFEDIGALLLAAEASAGAVDAFRERQLAARGRAAAARAAALAAACEDARTSALFGIRAPALLTRREREIGMLAARGFSSPEIARRLVVSVRTVEGHLYRLFAKLGVSRRDELGTLLGHPG
jgi:DNA-binding CsgD family transcriptional regulator/tetratricopeptide (TPR) repeat protein